MQAERLVSKLGRAYEIPNDTTSFCVAPRATLEAKRKNLCTFIRKGKEHEQLPTVPLEKKRSASNVAT